jgi:hypothetical protein
MAMPIAWLEGYRAWNEDTDVPLSMRCPYKQGSKEWELWYDGAEAAENDERHP